MKIDSVKLPMIEAMGIVIDENYPISSNHFLLNKDVSNYLAAIQRWHDVNYYKKCLEFVDWLSFSKCQNQTLQYLYCSNSKIPNYLTVEMFDYLMVQQYYRQNLIVLSSLSNVELFVIH